MIIAEQNPADIEVLVTWHNPIRINCAVDVGARTKS